MRPTTASLHLDEWDQDDVADEVESLIKFDLQGIGPLVFGYVQGQIEDPPMARDGRLTFSPCPSR